MNIWTTVKERLKAFGKTREGKTAKVIIPAVLVAFILIAALASNPRAISISYDDCAYDSYVSKRNNGYSFYTTDTGSFCTTHGIDPEDIQVHYFLAPSETLWDAFDNGNITIDDLDRLEFDYWFYSNGQ